MAKHDDVIPFDDSGKPRVYGLPVSTAWWSNLDPAEAEKLCSGERGEEAKFAAMVAAAFEELSRASQEGLRIAGLRWADVGGGAGHYAIALEVLGAASVTLVELGPRDAIPWSALDAAGVRVEEGGVEAYSDPEVDAVLCLYAPAVSLADLQASVPHCKQLVFDAGRQLGEVSGWSSKRVIPAHSFFLLGEGCAVTKHSPYWNSHSDGLVVFEGQSLGDATVVPPTHPDWPDADLEPVERASGGASGQTHFDDDDIPF